MYGIYANIWGILMVNVTIYSIHGSYGNYGEKNALLCVAETSTIIGCSLNLRDCRKTTPFGGCKISTWWRTTHGS